MPASLSTALLALGLVLAVAGFATAGVAVAIAGVAWQAAVVFAGAGSRAD